MEAVTEEESPGDALEVDDGKIVTSEEVTKAETGPAREDNSSGYHYTVYLFSTRSEEVAEQVNMTLQKAGHSTQIKVTETDSVTRYRVVVPGFKSGQSAKEFANSMVGKLGITDTWIGKERQ